MSKLAVPSAVRPARRSSKMRREDYESLAAVRVALRKFLAFSEMICAGAGVTTQHYQTMLAIRAHENQAPSVKELAEVLVLVPSAVVQLVDRMVKQGLVERVPSPTDGRSVLVKLTQGGGTVLAGLASQHMQELVGHRPLLIESLMRLRPV